MVEHHRRRVSHEGFVGTPVEGGDAGKPTGMAAKRRRTSACAVVSETTTVARRALKRKLSANHLWELKLMAKHLEVKRRNGIDELPAAAIALGLALQRMYRSRVLRASGVKGSAAELAHGQWVRVDLERGFCLVKFHLTKLEHVNEDGQVTLHWSKFGTMPAGVCNLNRFPLVQLQQPPLDMCVSRVEAISRSALFRRRANKLKTLILLIHQQAWLTTPVSHVALPHLPPCGAQFPEAFVGDLDARMVDAYGATPLHALMHANSEESLDCAAALINIMPQLLLSVQAGPLGFKSELSGYRPLPSRELSLSERTRMSRGGENALHIAVINQREDWILRVLGSSSDPPQTEGGGRWVLSDAELFSVVSQKADGPAFNEAPAVHFGSTVMAFAAVFGMRRLLTHVLIERFPFGHVFHKVLLNGRITAEDALREQPHLMKSRALSPINGTRRRRHMTVSVSSDAEQSQCPRHPAVGSYANRPSSTSLWRRSAAIEGMYSMSERIDRIRVVDGRTAYGMLHAVIANGNLAMYDFLVSVGADTSAEAKGLTPLKLCVRLGKLKMFEHIITQRMVRKSTWGPVREDYIALDEIDTMGLPGAMQVLELIAMSGTHRDAREMLSDDYMGGFLWQIVSHKWFLWGRTYHLMATLPEVVRTVLVTFIACPSMFEGIPRQQDLVAWIDPEYVESPREETWLVLTIILMAFLLARDVVEVFAWVRSRRAHPVFMGAKQTRRELNAIWAALRIWQRIMANLLGIIAIAIILGRSQLVGDGEQLLPSIRVVLAVSLLLCWIVPTSDLVMPWSEEMGTFSILVGKMLWSDVCCRFVPLFIPILISFSAAMTVQIPPATAIPGMERWSHISLSIENFLQLALGGSLVGNTYRPSLQLFGDPSDDHIAFAGAYVTATLYEVVGLLLLINLLIAIMSNTYERVRSKARMCEAHRLNKSPSKFTSPLQSSFQNVCCFPCRKWRIQITHNILRRELQLAVHVHPGTSLWWSVCERILPGRGGQLWKRFEGPRVHAIQSKYAKVRTIKQTAHRASARHKHAHVATLPLSEAKAGRVSVVEISNVLKWHYVMRSVDKHCTDVNQNTLRLITVEPSVDWVPESTSNKTQGGKPERGAPATAAGDTLIELRAIREELRLLRARNDTHQASEQALRDAGCTRSKMAPAPHTENHACSGPASVTDVTKKKEGSMESSATATYAEVAASSPNARKGPTAGNVKDRVQSTSPDDVAAELTPTDGRTPRPQQDVAKTRQAYARLPMDGTSSAVENLTLSRRSRRKQGSVVLAASSAK